MFKKCVFKIVLVSMIFAGSVFAGTDYPPIGGGIDTTKPITSSSSSPVVVYAANGTAIITAAEGSIVINTVTLAVTPPFGYSVLVEEVASLPTGTTLRAIVHIYYLSFTGKDGKAHYVKITLTKLPSTGNSAWTTQTLTDKLYGTTTYYFSSTSSDYVVDKYNQVYRPTINLRVYNNVISSVKDYEIYITTSEFLSSAGNSLGFKYRFDNNPVLASSATVSTDYQLLFIYNKKDFLTNLMNSETLILQYNPYGANNRTVSFDITNLKKSLDSQGISFRVLSAPAAVTIPPGYEYKMSIADAQGTVTYSGSANGVNVDSATGLISVDANAKYGATATITVKDGDGQTAATVVTVGVAMPLKKGWNMITSPMDNKKVGVDLLRSNGVTSVWALDSSRDAYSAPIYIEPGVGYWVRASADTIIVVDVQQATDTTKMSIVTALAKALAGKWNLLGTSTNTTKTYIKSRGKTEDVWWFNAANNSYSAIDAIPAGSGFFYKSSYPVSISPDAPSLSISIPSAKSSFEIGETVNFQASTTSDGTFEYIWDFGTGQTSTSQNPSTKYISSGIYTATCKITNTESGLSTSKSLVITIKASASDAPPPPSSSSSTSVTSSDAPPPAPGTAATSSTLLSAFSKPTQAACETGGGKWDTTYNECSATWDNANKICTMPSPDAWEKLIINCGATRNNIYSSATYFLGGGSGSGSCVTSKGFYVYPHGYWSYLSNDTSSSWLALFTSYDSYSIYKYLAPSNSYFVRCAN